ncbi:hypothetical protein SBA4_5060010 [Candidatus Sulfopaludibacter sp. SbA4]|nr:hypothetical protein SBA4_5060010 [Candidatus Sulfopaludibacter sp. SbA4]
MDNLDHLFLGVVVGGVQEGRRLAALAVGIGHAWPTPAAEERDQNYIDRDRARYGKLKDEEMTTWTDVAHWYLYLRREILFLVRLWGVW